MALALRPYIKGRDIWDVTFLRQQGIPLQTDWVIQKTRDYGINLDIFRQTLPSRILALQQPETNDRVREELIRFLQPRQLQALDTHHALDAYG